MQDGPTRNTSRPDLITANASWEVAGQTLTYNYGRQMPGQRNSYQINDFANMLPGFEPYDTTGNSTHQFFQTQEIRLSSQRDENRPFDYDIGWFQKHSHGEIFFGTDIYSLTPLGGAFGAPGTRPGVKTTPDSRYVLPVRSLIYLAQWSRPGAWCRSTVAKLPGRALSTSAVADGQFRGWSSANFG
ncbi:hypothetical protein [uncultured Sphingomonas sp.]|uniref:hypothetical protein n=1 Tax=uncultured Sphingomonas sp. TaxID=158754 RepID=UPI0026107613|nr:hypothetical protein [uncultured Sphingomonas sp.]